MPKAFRGFQRKALCVRAELSEHEHTHEVLQRVPAGRSILQTSPSPVLPSSTSTSANPGTGSASSSGAAEGGNPNSATTTSSSSAPSSSSASGSATGPNGTSTTSAASSSPHSVTYYCGSGLISVNLGCNSVRKWCSQYAIASLRSYCSTCRATSFKFATEPVLTPS